MASKYGYKGPTVDHTFLSPSGRVSKTARKAAQDRTAAELFPSGYFAQPEKTAAEKASEQAIRLRRSASNLRDLAARGMSPRKFIKQAELLEKQAETLDAFK